jgi:hypothetical protein
MLNLVSKVVRWSPFALRGDDQDVISLALAEFEESQNRVGDSIDLGKESFCDDSDSHDPQGGVERCPN